MLQSYKPLSKDGITKHLEDFGMEPEITNHNNILGLSGARLGSCTMALPAPPCKACSAWHGRLSGTMSLTSLLPHNPTPRVVSKLTATMHFADMAEGK